jgi:ankyrin repeat protein
MMIAAEEGHTEIVRLLLTHGADPVRGQVLAPLSLLSIKLTPSVDGRFSDHSSLGWSSRHR